MATAHRAVGGRRAMVSNRALTFRVGIANYMGFRRQQDGVQWTREGCCMHLSTTRTESSQHFFLLFRFQRTSPSCEADTSSAPYFETHLWCIRRSRVDTGQLAKLDCASKAEHIQFLILRFLSQIAREEIEERLHLDVECLQRCQG